MADKGKRTYEVAPPRDAENRLAYVAQTLDEADDYAIIDWTVGELKEIEKIVRLCADELIAVHHTTGIDVYDRVPGWIGVIRLIYPNWEDKESGYYGEYYK